MTATEKLWQSLDSDHDGLVAASDVAAATKKYRKSIHPAVAKGLERAFKNKVWNHKSLAKFGNPSSFSKGEDPARLPLVLRPYERVEAGGSHHQHGGCGVKQKGREENGKQKGMRRE